MNYYPSFEEIIQGNDKNNLLEVRRSLLSVISSMALFFILLVIVYIINVFFHDIHVPKDIPLLGGLSLRWLALLPALILLEILRKYHDDLYIFGSHRIRHFQGRLSLMSSLPSLKYTDILAVRVKQDIWGRLFNYGNVELDTAASSEVELTMSGVRAPNELALIADQFRVRSLAEGSVDKDHQHGIFNQTQEDNEEA